jgi:hypothetical protein
MPVAFVGLPSTAVSEAHIGIVVAGEFAGA